MGTQGRLKEQRLMGLLASISLFPYNVTSAGMCIVSGSLKESIQLIFNSYFCLQQQQLSTSVALHDSQFTIILI